METTSDLSFPKKMSRCDSNLISDNEGSQCAYDSDFSNFFKRKGIDNSSRINLSSDQEEDQNQQQTYQKKSELYSCQFHMVKNLLLESQLLDNKMIEKTCLDYYDNLGLNDYYFASSTPEYIANHVKVRSKFINLIFVFFSICSPYLHSLF